MSCGPRIAQIEAFVSEDYPTMPENQVRHTYTVNAARLLERVERVKYALKKPDDRLEAQRTYVQFSGSKVLPWTATGWPGTLTTACLSSSLLW